MNQHGVQLYMLESELYTWTYSDDISEALQHRKLHNSNSTRKQSFKTLYYKLSKSSCIIIIIIIIIITKRLFIMCLNKTNLVQKQVICKSWTSLKVNSDLFQQMTGQAPEQNSVSFSSSSEIICKYKP